MGENEELLARPPEEIFKEGTKKMNILEVIETETPRDLEVYINGQWQRSNTTEYQEVKNPATGEMLGKVPIATREDVDDAVQAALRAFPGWRRTPPEDRFRTSLDSSNSWKITLKRSRGSSSLKTGRRCPNPAVNCGAPSKTSKWPAEFPH